MYNAILRRLKAMESSQNSTGTPFYSLCMKWHSHPEQRQQMAADADMSIDAACFVYETGLKYGETVGTSKNPFSAWTTGELKEALRLIESDPAI